MTWQYTFIRADGSETVLPDEPVQWDNVSMVLQRDQDAHGISFLFSSSSLEFVEAAYWILKEEYVLNGVDGYMDIRIDWKCDDCTRYNSFIQATLNFGTYKEYCGAYCYISMGIEQNDATMLLTNRKDTNVDISSTIAYDGTTVLNDYAGLGKIITIPSKAIFQQSKAFTSNDNDNPDYEILLDADYIHYLPDFDAGTYNHTNEGIILPKLNNTAIEELADFTPQYQHDYIATDIYTDTHIQTVNNDSGLVLTNTYNVNFRFKGTLYFKYSFGSRSNPPITGGTIDVKLGYKLQYGTAHTDAFTPVEVAHFNHTTLTPLTIFEHTIDFDFTYNGTITLDPLDKVWFFFTYKDVQFNNSTFEPLREMTFSLTEDSFFNISSATLTAPSPCKTFLIHETGARILEHITDNQLTFKSAYYGRTDSQPFTFPVDGCGGLRAITNGLLLRRAVLQDNSTPNPFTSWKDFADTCKLMDCTGYGIEGNAVRLEPVEYFYKRVVVFVCDGVDVVEKTVRNDRIWSTWKFGYDKYETESTNGLDAIHTKREYRTSIRNSSASLEQYIKYIHDPYAIEATRRKYGTTQDWRYDNNIFGFCLQRGDIDFEVEQGNIVNAANLFDPATIINYRVSPIHNALRWFNWVAQGIKPLTDSRAMLFNAGEGNYVAEGQLFGVDCKLEAGVIAENEPLSLSVFADPNEAISFIEPEQVTFTYPLGLYEFLGLKDNMYGLIKYRRYETDDWSYGWIDKLEPNHEDGDAKFTLVTANSDLDIVDTGVYINGLATEDSRFILDENGNIILIEG